MTTNSKGFVTFPFRHKRKGGSSVVVRDVGLIIPLTRKGPCLFLWAPWRGRGLASAGS
jgi:hypothetical protein